MIYLSAVQVFGFSALHTFTYHHTEFSGVANPRVGNFAAVTVGWTRSVAEC